MVRCCNTIAETINAADINSSDRTFNSMYCSKHLERAGHTCTHFRHFLESRQSPRCCVVSVTIKSQMYPWLQGEVLVNLSGAYLCKQLTLLLSSELCTTFTAAGAWLSTVVGGRWSVVVDRGSAIGDSSQWSLIHELV